MSNTGTTDVKRVSVGGLAVCAWIRASIRGDSGGHFVCLPCGSVLQRRCFAAVWIYASHRSFDLQLDAGALGVRDAVARWSDVAGHVLSDC